MKKLIILALSIVMIGMVGNGFAGDCTTKYPVLLLHGVAMAESAMLKLYSRFGKNIEAHRICYEAAMKAFEEQRPLRETLLEHPELAAHVKASDLEDVLNPENYTGNCAIQVDAYCAGRR